MFNIKVIKQSIVILCGTFLISNSYALACPDPLKLGTKNHQSPPSGYEWSGSCSEPGKARFIGAVVSASKQLYCLYDVYPLPKGRTRCEFTYKLHQYPVIVGGGFWHPVDPDGPFPLRCDQTHSIEFCPFSM
jgi:hypothetical protein